jgi:phosphatidylglycerophosphatase A
VSARKPTLSIFLATACGLGYLPKAPGTWGSLGGLLLAEMIFLWSVRVRWAFEGGESSSFFFCGIFGVTILTAVVGVPASTRAASFWDQEDPQKVVIDEVSGQLITLLLGCVLPVAKNAVSGAWNVPGVWRLAGHYPLLNWKYLLLGFILFRAFDIWKPFPARQAESLPRGWGIMADDWVAGVYAGLLLWLARAVGL